MTGVLEFAANPALLDAARAARKDAAGAYDAAATCFARLSEQRAAGIWQSETVAATLDQARRDQSLLRMNVFNYTQAHGGGHNLPLDYHPLLAEGPAPRNDILAGALAFLDRLRSVEGDTELWLQALKLEAAAYLHRLRGDRALRSALRHADRYARQLLAGVDRLAPEDARRLSAYAAALNAHRSLSLPWRILALYRRFLARFPSVDPVADLIARLEADFEAVPREVFEAWGRIADSVAPALELTNPADTRELENIIRIQTPVFAVIEGRADLPVVAVEETPVAVLRRAGRHLRRVLAAVPAGSRAAAVLAAWQGLAALGLNDYAGLLRILDGIEPDGEALGILVRALRGEARYRLGHYEDAYLDLLRAESRALAALERRGPDRSVWSRAERDALARLAQKAGNALLAIGDEVKADEAFARAREWLPDDPTLRAVDLINRGQLLFLRNALDRAEGYMAVDRVLQKRVAEQGPAALTEERLRRHLASLDEAERAYRQALALLPESTRDLVALCHLNLGNLWWARAKAQGPQDDRAAAYATASAAYERALALTEGVRRGEAPALAAAALANLSEVRYLAHRTDARTLRRALREAQRALALARRATLHPDLVWQANLNIARIKQALGDHSGAESAYVAALAAVEALRAALRADAWQALFLRDKMEVYEEYLAFLFERDAADRVSLMFGVIEQMRARAFLDLLARANVRAALPDELRGRADNLLGRIAACNEVLRAATLGDDEKAARKLLADQRKYGLQWADLQAEMAAAQAQDEQLNPPPITLSETQARLGPERVLLLYQLGETASHLLLVTGDAAHAFRLPPRQTIELAALPVLFDCSFGDENAIARFRERNAALSAHLLGPLDPLGGAQAFLRGKHVLVAPDAALHYLPFEALFPRPADVAALPPAARFADLKGHYLIDIADVSYVPSASAWRELSDRPRGQAAASLLAVYDVSYDTGGQEPPLWALPILMKLDSVPGARDVRKAIELVRAAWPDLPVAEMRSRRDDETLEEPDRQPTEQNFLRVAPATAARFVVFNGHAMRNDKHPGLSGLVFNLTPPREPDAAAIPSDNFLRVDELFRLELPGAEITFLAACQTALGAPYRGEGLNALLRAFMYRGSPAVVATLWAVDANAASWLVRRFFKLLSENPAAEPARLFSQAKRASIGFDNRWLPFHWAPFIYSGGTQ